MNTLRTLLLLVVVTFAVNAQPPGPPGERSLERIEHLKKLRLVELLDMKEEQAVRFFARLKDHDAAMKSLMQGKMEALDRIERLVRNEADQKDLEKAFPDALAFDEKIIQEKQKFFDSLADILTVQQRAQYLLFERQVERELREALREVRQRRFRG